MTTPASGSDEAPKKKGWVDMQMLLSMHLPAISIGFGLGATVVVIPKLTQDLGEGMVAAMMVFILQQLGTAVAPIPTGYLIDRIGRRKMLLAGPILISISSMLIVRVIVIDKQSFFGIHYLLCYMFFFGVGIPLFVICPYLPAFFGCYLGLHFLHPCCRLRAVYIRHEIRNEFRFYIISVKGFYKRVFYLNCRFVRPCQRLFVWVIFHIFFIIS